MLVGVFPSQNELRDFQSGTYDGSKSILHSEPPPAKNSQSPDRLRGGLNGSGLRSDGAFLPPVGTPTIRTCANHWWSQVVAQAN
jgi:hypothetical protein